MGEKSTVSFVLSFENAGAVLRSELPTANPWGQPQQEDTKQGCSNSLPAVQEALMNPLPPPASSAYPRLPRCWSGPLVG